MAHHPGIALVFEKVARRIARELNRALRAGRARKRAAPEQLHRAIQVVVHALHVVFNIRKRCVEAKTSRVYQVAHIAGQVVGVRIPATHKALKRRVEADTQWIESLKLCCAQWRDSALIVHIGNGAATIGVERNRPVFKVAERIPAPVVVEEEEQLVLHDRSADVAAELVPDQRRTRRPIVVVEPVVRFQVCVAVVLHKSAVELVRSALGHKLELSAATFARAGKRSRCHATEFLH